MKQLRSPFTFVLTFLVFASFAQDVPAPPPAPAPTAIENGENIIIRRKGDSKEKLTIVVDGDNITINGKPAKDFKGADVRVMRGHNRLIPAIPSVMPQGGAKSIMRNFNFKSNDALLGIMMADDANGAKVTKVTAGSAAEKAGLKEGDVITHIAEKAITSADDIYEAIGNYKPNDKVTIRYKRDNKENTATATLDKNTARPFVWNNDEKDFELFRMNEDHDFPFVWNNNNKPRLGLRIQDTENSTGVTVMEVDDEDAPAAKAGLKAQDVIVEVNGVAVHNVQEVKEQIKDAKPGDAVKLQYKRNGNTQTATVQLPKKLQTSDL